MTYPLVLAALDAAVAMYLPGWALRRERRDRARVAVVGLLLAVCATLLAVVSWPGPPLRELPPLPSGTGPTTAV